MEIQKYSTFPTTLTVPEDKWKDILKESIEKHGIKWISKRLVCAPTQESSQTATEGTPTTKKFKPGKPVNYLWYREYHCHRTGSKRDRIVEGYNAKGGASGKSRDLQKASKKIDCPVKLMTYCYKNDPSNVVLSVINQHNHHIGGVSDMQYLPLSEKTKKLIMQRLNEGFAVRASRLAIQNNFHQYLRDNIATDASFGSSIVHRDQMVHADEIYNLYKKIQEKSYKLTDGQQESIKLWLAKLSEKGCQTFLGADFVNSYAFGFVSP
ncbi:hypothetical protein PS15p_211343 [Mucor circinelloides]